MTNIIMTTLVRQHQDVAMRKFNKNIQMIECKKNNNCKNRNLSMNEFNLCWIEILEKKFKS